jgi:uncharacterized membrane protein YgdD (TMEM256/DUF423 family)
MKERGWIGLAAVLGLAAVAAGAFAAHGLEAQGDGRAAAWVETASRHQMWHALAMLAYLALGPASRWPLRLWAVGGVLFPISLYALALGAPPTVAMLAPVGGMALIAGWAALAWSAVTARR